MKGVSPNKDRQLPNFSVVRKPNRKYFPAVGSESLLRKLGMKEGD